MRQRFLDYRSKVLQELHKSFHEDRSPEEIARSFSIGIFITALPTLGAGLLLFAVLVKLFDSISRIALLSSVVILNPLIKPVIYLASINLGGILLTRSITITADPALTMKFLLLGNTVIAALLALIGYLFALKTAKRFREKDVGLMEDLEKTLPAE